MMKMEIENRARWQVSYGLWEVVNDKAVYVGNANIFINASTKEKAIGMGQYIFGAKNLKPQFHYGINAHLIPDEETEQRLRELLYDQYNESLPNNS